jgi:DNA-binding GntR family transcriptional regulator
VTPRAEQLPRGTRARRRDTVAAVTDELRGLIISGKIAPGAELSQVELAQMVGVSTTPVREALRALEAEGIIQFRHNRRPQVPEFDPGDLEAVYCCRILMEGLALSVSVPTMTSNELARLEAQLEGMRSTGAVEDLAHWDLAHSAFHTGLIFGCEPALRRQIRLMMARADRYRRMSVLGERPHAWTVGESEHVAILAACEARDPELAAALLAKHLERSARSVLARMAPDYAAASLDAAVHRMLGDSGARPSTLIA